MGKWSSIWLCQLAPVGICFPSLHTWVDCYHWPSVNTDTDTHRHMQACTMHNAHKQTHTCAASVARLLYMHRNICCLSFQLSFQFHSLIAWPLSQGKCTAKVCVTTINSPVRCTSCPHIITHPVTGFSYIYKSTWFFRTDMSILPKKLNSELALSFQEGVSYTEAGMLGTFSWTCKTDALMP